MCIILDTNTFGMVINEENAHFSKIRDFYQNRSIKLNVGGTRYLAELGRHRKMLKLYQDKNYIARADDDEIDEEERRLAGLFTKSEYDDPHIVALARKTNVKLLVTDDNGLMNYISERGIFRRAADRPKIFNSRTRPTLIGVSMFRHKCKLCQ